MLADLARGRMKAKHAALVEALTGRFDDHHGEIAAILLVQIDGLTVQIDALTSRIEQLIASIPPAQGVDADGTTGPQAGEGLDAPVLPAIARLDEIPGVSRHAAQVIIAETGLDMTRFPTAGHLVSWAKLSPRTIQSGARNRPGRTGKGNPYLKGVLGDAAAAAGKTDTFLGSGTGGWSSAAASSRPWLRSPAPCWSSSGTCSPPGPPATTTWAPATTPAEPNRHRPPGTQPHPPARSPRIHRHPRPRRRLVPPAQNPAPLTLRRVLPRAHLGLGIFRSTPLFFESAFEPK